MHDRIGSAILDRGRAPLGQQDMSRARKAEGAGGKRKRRGIAARKPAIVVAAADFNMSGAKRFRERGDWETGQTYDVEGQGLHCIRGNGIQNGKPRYRWKVAAE